MLFSVVPSVWRKCLVQIDLAICNIVFLMSLVILLHERQNFRFKPKSSFVPSGSFCVLHKLWKARFFGCNHGHKGFACRANLKFFDLDKAGFAQKLKLRRQYCSVRFLRAAPTLLWLHLKASFFIRRCFLSWANLLEVAFCGDWGTFLGTFSLVC